MPENNLDAEIEQWLNAATVRPELVIPPMESDLIKSATEIAKEANAMSDFDFTDIPVWDLDVEKGGPGSGEHDGHPFRGNGHSSATHQFHTAHNEREGHKTFGHHEHLDRAIGHHNAGTRAIHEGRHGDAMRHFNEAAYHYAGAAHKVIGKGDTELHQLAKTGYANAHHAGDQAEIANKATRDLARAQRNGADDTTLGLLGARAAVANGFAHDAARIAGETAHSVGTQRFGDAVFGGGASQAQ